MKPVYIDIGSQTGKEIGEMLEKGYEVHAFEPNRKHEAHLAQYITQARVNFVAAWNKYEIIPFFSNEDSPERDVSSSVISTNTNNRTEPYKVMAIDTGDYLKTLDKDIDIIKIDAEGAEYVIIESILDHFDPKRIKEWRVEDHSGYIADKKWHEHKQSVLKRISDLGITLKEWR